MVTHQNDWQRMAFMAWALAKYRIYSFIETGCGEGETIGYFGQFADYAGGCDIRSEVIQIAKNRYPHIQFTCQDALEFLKTVPCYYNTFFYLDCTWLEGCPAKDQLPIIFERWDKPTIFVSGASLDNGSSGAQKLEDLANYGKIIIPTYRMSNDQSGYALIIPKVGDIFLPDSWKLYN